MIFSRDEDGYDMSSIKLNYETQVFFNLGYVLELHICTLRAVVEGQIQQKTPIHFGPKVGGVKQRRTIILHENRLRK